MYTYFIFNILISRYAHSLVMYLASLFPTNTNNFLSIWDKTVNLVELQRKKNWMKHQNYDSLTGLSLCAKCHD